MAQVGTPIGHSMMGNAAEWPSYARSYGYSVSHSPSAGSAIVFQQGLAGADPTYGHVAFVEAVNADGSLYISGNERTWIKRNLLPYNLSKRCSSSNIHPFLI